MQCCALDPVDELIRKEISRKASKEVHGEEDSQQDWTYAYDDVSGAKLSVKRVKEAREAEMKYFKRMNVYRKVPLKKCWALTGC